MPPKKESQLTQAMKAWMKANKGKKGKNEDKKEYAKRRYAEFKSAYGFPVKARKAKMVMGDEKMVIPRGRSRVGKKRLAEYAAEYNAYLAGGPVAIENGMSVYGPPTRAQYENGMNVYGPPTRAQYELATGQKFVQPRGRPTGGSKYYGQRKMNKDGTFRKTRKDAGKKKK